ncbi:MAG: helix-turn-helix domain-containing protein [Eubacteriales bacterium]|nr:helix-turn-helix domain-containing protein [Eubacteriales bacterium]
MRARLSCIQGLLLNTDYSLKAISGMCGFEDENAFVKFFKYHEGLTPTKYRNRYFRTHRNNH